jgi:hypothetical protein
VAYSIRWGDGGSVCDGAMVTRRISCRIVRVFRFGNSPAYTVYRLFLASIDITLKRFQDTSRICGNIPRQCFEAAVSPATLHNATSVIKAAIGETEKLSEAVKNVNCGDTIHRAFQIRPSQIRFWDSCLVEPVSDWAFSEMMNELGKQSTDAAYKFYCAIKGSPLSFCAHRNDV